MNKIQEYNEQIFEKIKHIDESGNEYWYARELQKVLNYTQWRRFENVIEKAKFSCKNSNININDHFANVGEMVEIGSKAKREQIDYKLSRYACYLIALAGEERKALAPESSKKDAKHPLLNDYYELNPLARIVNPVYNKLKNIVERNELVDNNTKETKKKNISQDISMDEYRSRGNNRGLEEVENTSFSLSENYKGSHQIENANSIVHYNMSKDIKRFIKEQGGTMPENLPTPNKSIKEIENKKEG